MENKYLTVSAINRYLNAKISSDINLKNMPIQGEISNARLSKGHLYFVLKDEESEISAIMFSNNVALLNFTPVDGMKVIVKASLQVYEKRGTYSLLVTNMKEYGLGLLYQEFLKLKEKLAKEGLFEASHKRTIPKFSENIGLITSPTGDAMHDVVSTISKRFPLATIYLYPALVQGNEAPLSLINAINKMNQDNLVDVCIVARGGGSFEDLSCFNDEALARTVYNSKTPIVTGVGHEADYTIIDFVSDFRAPTPTGAGVVVSSDKMVLLTDLLSKKRRLSDLVIKTIDNKSNKLESLCNNHYLKNFDEYLNKFELRLLSEIDHLEANSPKRLIEKNIEALNLLKLRLKGSSPINKINEYSNQISLDKKKLVDYSNNVIRLEEVKLDSLFNKMILLNPLNIMKKGYSLVYQDDKLITSINDLDKDKELVTKMHDGEFTSVIKNINKG